MTVLTDLGDLAVLLPLAGLMLLWLVTLRPRSVAGYWATAVMLCVGLTGLSKIYFFACSPDRDLVSPSGHTSFSMLVYGSIALIVAAEGSGWLRGATLGAGTALIAGIAGSRLILGVHSLPEIALGMVIGFAALAVFAWGYLRQKPVTVPLRPLVLAAALLMAFLHGHELRAEEMLHAISAYLRIGSVFCR
jgi:membrane-associated phospholipid phosphatase